MQSTWDIQPNNERHNELIHREIRRYNRLYMHDLQDYSFHIEENGDIIAGIVAGSTIDTLEVEFLFVSEGYRGKGLGGRLLDYVEERAREAGMKRVLLNTYSFQAPDFYLKKGYARLFQIDPCFGDFTQYFYIKIL